MFLTFALITLAGAVALVFQRNLVVAGLCLVLSFAGVAGLFLLLGNPVAAALQVIVYSGAIVVLLLFVIMLLNEHQEESALRPRPLQRWLSVLVTVAMGAGAVRLVFQSALLRGLDRGARPRCPWPWTAWASPCSATTWWPSRRRGCCSWPPWWGPCPW